MCAIGIFLFCYRGYDWIESWTGNLGCLSALGVALCPLDANSDPLYQRSVLGYLHTVSGGTFFLTLAFYSLDVIRNKGYNSRMMTYATLQSDRREFLALTGLTLPGIPTAVERLHSGL